MPPSNNVRIGTNFENYLAGIMNHNGWQAKAIGKRGDHGADIIATDPRGNKYVIQCKCWANTKVGVDVIEKLIGPTTRYYPGRRRWIATTSSLTEQARQLAIRNDVIITELIQFPGLSPERVPPPKQRITDSSPRKFPKFIGAFALAAACVFIFLMKAHPSQPELPGRGCQAGYVCMYTVNGFISNSPEHKYYYYGCYALNEEFGDRYILNSQISGAEVSLYTGQRCSRLVTTIPRLSSWNGSITPINSIKITP